LWDIYIYIYIYIYIWSICIDIIIYIQKVVCFVRSLRARLSQSARIHTWLHDHICLKCTLFLFISLSSFFFSFTPFFYKQTMCTLMIMIEACFRIVMWILEQLIELCLGPSKRSLGCRIWTPFIIFVMSLFGLYRIFSCVGLFGVLAYSI